MAIKDFKPNVAAGSVYAIEVKKIATAKILISQDNGQQIVVHTDDVPNLIKELKRLTLPKNSYFATFGPSDIQEQTDFDFYQMTFFCHYEGKEYPLYDKGGILHYEISSYDGVSNQVFSKEVQDAYRAYKDITDPVRLEDACFSVSMSPKDLFKRMSLCLTYHYERDVKITEENWNEHWDTFLENYDLWWSQYIREE